MSEMIWGLGSFRSHLSFSLYPHLVYILGEHRSHMGLPQRTHVTSDLLRSYKLCSIQSRMWDIPTWYLQLPTIKRFIVWSLQDDTKQKSNASICFAGVQLFMEMSFCTNFLVYSLNSFWNLLKKTVYCLNDQFWIEENNLRNKLKSWRK